LPHPLGKTNDHIYAVAYRSRHAWIRRLTAKPREKCGLGQHLEIHHSIFCGSKAAEIFIVYGSMAIQPLDAFKEPSIIKPPALCRRLFTDAYLYRF